MSHLSCRTMTAQLVLLLVFASSAYAQFGTGTILGTISRRQTEEHRDQRNSDVHH